jgi:hypothetical protein
MAKKQAQEEATKEKQETIKEQQSQTAEAEGV